VFAMVDTNSDPRNIDFIIPANDDAKDSVEVILTALCDAINEGLEERKLEKEKEAEAAPAQDTEAAAPAKKLRSRRAPKAEAVETPAATEE